MFRNILPKITFLFFLCSCNLYGQDKIQYPIAEQSNQTDTIWGTVVKDPYRWMEDIKSPEVKEWLKAEKKVTDEYSGRTSDLKHYLQFYNEMYFKPIFREGKYYFNYAIDDEGETPGLYYQKDDDDESELLFDPNRLDKSATINITDIALSEDNKTLALMLSKNGSDWNTLRFLDMKTKELLNDSVNFVKYSDIYWYKNGLFYTKYNVKNTEESFKGLIKGRTLYYHKIGTNQKEDIMVFKPENDYDDIDFSVSKKNNYIILYHVFYDDGKKQYGVAISNLNDSLLFTFKDFIITSKREWYFNVIGKQNNKLLVESNFNAPNGAIYKYDPHGINQAEKFIPQYADQLIFSKLMCHKIISGYTNDSTSFGVIRDSTGKLLSMWKIPEGASYSHYTGEENDSILIVGFHSFFTPPTIYKVNVNTFKKKPLSVTYINFDNSGLITRKTYYYSKDSTIIPMYITYRKGIKLDGKNPTILYGYGGFGISMEPFLNIANIIFFRNGGILATPCLRGGGDYPGWHEQGMRLNKQNTFDDFIAAAEYLISNKYTNPEKLAAMGASNGGLLIGAVILQRPDLFKVAISYSGVLDMMRYHLYNVGYVYKDEYGNITDSLDFKNLLNYSPVQNVKSGVNYPATLLVASDNDDRVNPFHSFKFLASLQANGSNSNPYVLYYQKNAGHYGSDVETKDVETKAYIYAFLFKYLGIENKIIYEQLGK